MLSTHQLGKIFHQELDFLLLRRSGLISLAFFGLIQATLLYLKCCSYVFSSFSSVLFPLNSGFWKFKKKKERKKAKQKVEIVTLLAEVLSIHFLSSFSHLRSPETPYCCEFSVHPVQSVSMNILNKFYGSHFFHSFSFFRICPFGYT